MGKGIRDCERGLLRGQVVEVGVGHRVASLEIRGVIRDPVLFRNSLPVGLISRDFGG